MERFGTFLKSVILSVITLVPGALLAQFNLLTPPDNATLTIEGLASTTADVTWEADNNLTGSVTYTWMADFPGGDFSAPIAAFPSNNAGVDTVLTLDYASIDGLLASQGINQGQTATLIWTVESTNGTQSDTATPFTLSLVRGVLASPFDLLTPPTSTALTVEGLGTNTADITWNSAGAGVTYTWLVDAQGGNFANPIATVPSNNMGMDTVLTLDFATIEAVLEGAGVTQGQTANLIWQVRAFAGTDSVISTQTFDIDLTNGTVANAYDLLSPANATALTVEGLSTNTIDITWASSGEGVTYVWMADAAGGNFSSPIVSVPSNNMGMDTVLTLDFATIESVLEGAGVTQGQTANLIWQVRAFAGTDSLNSTQSFAVDLTNGAVIDAYDLLTPPTGTAATIEGLGTATIDITWNSAGEGATYTWLVDAQGGNFSAPIATVPSNNMGMDTVLTLDFATINAVLEGAGVTLGQTANLIWRVHAFGGADSVISTQTFDIDLTNGAVAEAYDLLTPPNATALTVEGLGTNTIDITWQSSGEGVTYVWMADAAGGNFTSPIVSVPSNNMGMDTVLTLDLSTIEAVLEGAGVTQGQTANLIWQVRAFAGTDSLNSTQNFSIDLTNGAVAEPYDLLTPPNATALTVEGLGSTTVDITWNSSGEGVTYEWLLDAAGGNFSNPIVSVPSNNMGMDTVLTLDFATINAVLEGAGVTLGQTANLIWRVHAFAGMDSLASTQTFTIDLTNGAVAEAYDLLTPPNATALTIEGLSTNTIDISWASSGEGVTYAWLLDVQGGNFSSPIVSVPSNNMGMDTVLTLDLATVEAVLEGAGVTQGQNVDLIWRVHAFAGTDSLPSSQDFDINLTNGDVAFPYDLLAPTNLTALTVEGLGTATVDITWASSGEGVSYTWLLDAQGNDFSNPIVEVPSNNSGADTMLTLDFATINAVLEGAGVALGQSASLIWRVHAFAGTDSLPSTQTFDINLTNGAVAEAFDLTFPADGFSATIADDASQDITITWEESGEGVTYAWLLDEAGGDFTSLIAGPITSNNNGLDAALTLDFATIHSVLVGAGVQEGGTANLTWRVHAYAANDSLVSVSEFDIDLTRAVTTSVNEIAPNSQVELFPNPVAKGAAVNLTGVEVGSTLDIIDLSGKVERTQVVTGVDGFIATDGLNTGVYLVRIAYQDAISVKRLVIH